jgi:hypothetical protein
MQSGMAMQGAGLGGAAPGGAMVAPIGPDWVLAADTIAGSLRSLRDVNRVPPREPGGGMLADLREGRREFAGRPWLWGIVVRFSIANAVVGAAVAVYGPLAARDDMSGAGPWGLALAFLGAGTVGGALLMTRWRPRRLLLAGTLCVPDDPAVAALATPALAGPSEQAFGRTASLWGCSALVVVVTAAVVEGTSSAPDGSADAERPAGGFG